MSDKIDAWYVAQSADTAVRLFAETTANESINQSTNQPIVCVLWRRFTMQRSGMSLPTIEQGCQPAADRETRNCQSLACFNEKILSRILVNVVIRWVVPQRWPWVANGDGPLV